MHHVLGLSASASWLGAIANLLLVLMAAVFWAPRQFGATEPPWQRPLGSRRRWVLAVMAAVAPVWCPSRGIGSTIVTGFAVVLAVRLADRDEHVARRRPDAGALAIWCCVPLARAWPDESQRRAHRPRALRFVLRAFTKRALWELISYGTAPLDPAQVPWPLRTVYVVLYFVLNFTALADLVLAGLVALGWQVDEVFDWPLLSRSAREFWSRRWNLFINRFALKRIALPLRRRGWPEFGIVTVVFVASGIFHEYFAWGASGARTVPGAMMSFFCLQIVALGFGRFTPGSQHWPASIRVALTATWMAVSAPLFFVSLVPALEQLGFPPAWLPLTP